VGEMGVVSLESAPRGEGLLLLGGAGTRRKGGGTGKGAGDSGAKSADLNAVLNSGNVKWSESTRADIRAA